MDWIGHFMKDMLLLVSSLKLSTTKAHYYCKLTVDHTDKLHNFVYYCHQVKIVIITITYENNLKS